MNAEKVFNDARAAMIRAAESDAFQTAKAKAQDAWELAKEQADIQWKAALNRAEDLWDDVKKPGHPINRAVRKPSTSLLLIGGAICLAIVLSSFSSSER